MDITLIDDEISDRDYELKEEEELTLNLAFFDVFKPCKINVTVGKNATLNAAFADFGKGEGVFEINVYLNEEGATCNFHSSCLAANEDKKVFDTSVFHNAPRTSALMSNYGITRDHGRLLFAGISEIKKGSVGAATRQEAKIIVFDPECKGSCSPSLKIDENEVVASHAATVGRLNEQHLFYLLSRGIDEQQAKRLITLGHLKPVEQYFIDPELRQRIDKTIDEGI